MTQTQKVTVPVRLLVLGAILYVAVVATKHDALAAVNITDCISNLDVEGETYILQNNINERCNITANNVIIDGQDLYSINNDVRSFGLNITVNDVTSVDNVISSGSGGYYSAGDDAGNITIDNTVITGDVIANGGDGYYGAGGSAGSVVITNSSANNVYAIGGQGHNELGGTGGYINISDSDITSGVYATGGESNSVGGDGGTIIFTDSSAGYGLNTGGGDSTGANNGGDGGAITMVRSSATFFVETNAGYGYYGSGYGGDVILTDSTVGGEGVSTYGDQGNGNLTINDSEPVITLLGDNPLELEFEEAYVEPGATAEDILDGDLTEDIVVTGAVGASAGEYEITYEVTDAGSGVTWNGDGIGVPPQTTEETRTVTRLAGVEVYELSTLSATDITQTSATMRGQIISGDFEPGSVGFAFGLESESYIDQIGPADEIGTLEETGLFTITFSEIGEEELECGTTYYYAALGFYNEGDFVLGDEVSFTTLGCESEETTTPRRSSSTSASRAIARQAFTDYYAEKEETSSEEEAPLSQSNNQSDNETPNTCPISQILTQNLKQGAIDGQYHNYTGVNVTEVALLQQYINEILADAYAQAAGPVDGIFGVLTKQGVERMQQALLERYGQDLGSYGIDGIVGPFTRAAINGWCEGDIPESN